MTKNQSLLTGVTFLTLLACCTDSHAQDVLGRMQRESDLMRDHREIETTKHKNADDGIEARLTDEELKAKAQELCNQPDGPAKVQAIDDFRKRHMLSEFTCYPGKPRSGTLSDETKDQVTPDDWAEFARLCMEKAPDDQIIRLLEKYDFADVECPSRKQ